ncbi:MAG: ABC transporter permease [Caldilineaceae bacterium]|nr:ABC transporter permease [Caldilineaceae bacterium]
MTSAAPVTRRRTPTGDAIRQLRKNKMAVVGLIVILIMIFIALFVDTSLFTFFTGGKAQPLIAPYHYAEVDFLHANAPPLTRTEEGKFYILGTDYLGRDNLSRTLYGSRISLSVAIVAATVSLIVGLIYGMISGYGSAVRDNFMMRVVDFLYGFPLIIFIILMQVYFKALSATDDTNPFVAWLIRIDDAMGGIFLVFVAIGLLNWLGMARIARGQTLSFKRKEFVEASRSVGSNDGRIIRKHILPNILGPCIVAETLAIPGYILLESFLSFIGLGANPPTPSWGIMISETYQAMRVAPMNVFAPAVALTLTTLAFNFLGDGLRDAFDPRLAD